MRTSPASQSTKKKGTALANSPPTDVADRILRSDFTSSGALMSATNGKPPGRPPHKHSKAVPPKPGDEQGAYTRAQLVSFDNRFRSRLCAPSSAARRAVRPPLTRSRLLVGEIIKRSLKLRRCRLRLLGSPLPRLLLVLALLALADECGPQLTLLTAQASP